MKTCGLLAAAVGMPLAVQWARGRADPRCDFDGAKVERTSRVDVIDGRGRPHVFCCPTCANNWLRRQQDPPRSITVTDEVSSQPVDAAEAWFVRSSDTEAGTTGRRMHVFRSQADAEQYADTYHGTILLGSEKPFYR
jgi:hypothetical protein